MVRGNVQVMWEGIPIARVCVPVTRGNARVRWESAPVAKEGITVAGGKVEVRLEGIPNVREGIAVSRGVLQVRREDVGFNRGDIQVLLEETGGLVSVHGAGPLDRTHREDINVTVLVNMKSSFWWF